LYKINILLNIKFNFLQIYKFRNQYKNNIFNNTILFKSNFKLNKIFKIKKIINKSIFFKNFIFKKYYLTFNQKNYKFLLKKKKILIGLLISPFH
jgi:hypothetical protein